MKDKISAFYGILSIMIWSLVMLILIGIIVLFFIGENQAAVIDISQVTLSCAGENDMILHNKSIDGNGWYKAEIQANITAGKWTPFSYTASEIAVLQNFCIDISDAGFALLDEDIAYSKINSDDFCITYYFKASDINSAENILKHASFGLRKLEQHYGFFKKDIVMYYPYLDLSAFDGTLNINV